MKNLLQNLIQSTKSYNCLMDELNKKDHVGVVNIDESLALLYAVNLLNKENILLICENELQGEKITTSLNEISPGVASFLHSEPSHFYFVNSHSKELTHERIQVFHEILFRKKRIIVTPLESLFKKLMPPKEYKKLFKSIKVGQIIEMDEFVTSLTDSGYQRCEMVENPGQFSVRGGLVDVFNIIDKNPVRVEFFDDEIDSIRVFDIENQQSMEKLDTLKLSPAHEILFKDYEKQELYDLLQKDMEKAKKKNGQRQVSLENLAESYINGQVENVEGLIPYYKGELSSLMDYFSQDTHFLFFDGDRFSNQSESFVSQLKEDFQSLLEKGEIFPNFFQRFFTFEEIQDFLQEKKTVDFQSLSKKFNFIKAQAVIEVNSKEVYSFYGKIPEFVDQLAQWKKENYTLIILGQDKSRCNNINEMLSNYSIEGHIQKEDILYKKVNIIQGSLAKGFVLYEDKLVVLSDRDIFKEKAKSKKKKKNKKGKKIESFTDLKVGDYIVHDTHGIGLYAGIEQIAVEGIKKDYLHLKYAKGDKLYIPVDQMDSVQVYIGFGDKKPKVNKLGSGEWKKSKQKTKESVTDMAKELLEMYAKRRQAKGYAFSKDNNWTIEFEEKFPYEETGDQLQSIEEVKADMESNIPMDRLICGDVGYGKTEVAIRAAFKCIMDNRQVAMLVPTTILAQQHYNSFMSRFEDYPIRIEMLSRFRTKKQQEQIIEDIKRNQVDIVIGTHRLLSKDVRYHDLGLLIVDEEQRFGVKHKEQIKELKTNIDVLTLSATPIPRTLHMSLVGARDMSILNEPPHNRTPVQTYIMEYNEILLRDAINRELARSGQVYYVYNKVHDIESVVAKVSRMVPEARIAVAHGQMSETKLENIMMDFMDHEYDILVCTTIIESGLDISNANTIIIEDADHMGLSQLYQLRGRVGRSNRLSYAYITYRKDKTLSEIAEKRLKALRDFTEFGSGFKIAMRDLEIRGAGSMLGSKQHGHLTTVGYDMYCKILDEAVKELKGEETLVTINTTIEVDVDAYIPSTYVESEKQKYQLYKKIIGIESQSELNQIEEDIEDRYGNLPKSVQNLLYISYIKKMSSSLGIDKIKDINNQIIFTFEKSFFLSVDEIKEIIKEYPVQFNTDKSGNTSLILKKSLQDKNILIRLKEFVEKIKAIKEAKNSV